jgi:hypothetical protein
MEIKQPSKVLSSNTHEMSVTKKKIKHEISKKDE